MKPVFGNQGQTSRISVSRPGDLDEASLPPKRGPQQLVGARRNIAVALAMATWPAAGRSSAAVLYSCWACAACALAGILNHLQNAAHVPGAYRRAATPQTVPLVELNWSCAAAASRQAGDQDRKLNTTAPPANYMSHSLLPPPGCWITLVGCFSECWGFPGRLASLMQARPFLLGCGNSTMSLCVAGSATWASGGTVKRSLSRV